MFYLMEIRIFTAWPSAWHLGTSTPTFQLVIKSCVVNPILSCINPIRGFCSFIYMLSIYISLCGARVSHFRFWETFKLNSDSIVRLLQVGLSFKVKCYVIVYLVHRWYSYCEYFINRAVRFFYCATNWLCTGTAK